MAEAERQNYLVMKNDMPESNLKNISRLHKENYKSFYEFKHHLNVLHVFIIDDRFDRIKEYIEDIAVPQGFISEYATDNEIIDIVLNVKAA